MKIILLANANSSHTQKWASSLSREGLEVIVFTLSAVPGKLFSGLDIRVESVGIDNAVTNRESRGLSKIRYLLSLPRLRRLIAEIKPDVLHAHYASSYGVLGALSGFHPFLVSLWGSDIFAFPRKSFAHKAVLEFSLRKADGILSTSHVMAREASQYTNKSVEMTPFGVDIDAFRPQRVISLFKEADIVIGTVKALETVYGIDYLIRAFALLVNGHPHLPLKLLIVGGGSQESYLRSLAEQHRVDHLAVFTNHVNHEEVPRYLNMLSIFVALSNSESFGVAVVEASACEKPVVVSNVGGLPEVVEDGVTGFIVPPRNPEKAAEALEKLVVDAELRATMGCAGRARVKNFYNWRDNVAQMMRIYRQVKQAVG